MYLVKFESNWADELEVYGFRIFTTDEWAAYKKACVAYFKDYGAYSYAFGTNEAIEFDNLEELLATFTVTPITEANIKTLIALGLGVDYGNFPSEPHGYEN